MTETVYCAHCRERFTPDQDHVQIDAEIKKIDDKNDRDFYILHLDCFREITDDWIEPA